MGAEMIAYEELKPIVWFAYILAGCLVGRLGDRLKWPIGKTVVLLWLPILFLLFVLDNALRLRLGGKW